MSFYFFCQADIHFCHILTGFIVPFLEALRDEPLTRDAFATALAHSVGRRRLFRIPNGIMKLLAGTAADMINRSQRVSNRHFQERTTWKPTVPNAQKGGL
ncbi:MAG: hypothetical protein J2P36_18870 [Ktedonobacteraceae bacterium]|nr:hypothetical protein [Ktedonobacteraceae bacterium]